MQGIAGLQGHELSSPGLHTLTVTRRYTPTVAIVFGILLFPIGLLLFLVKETETAVITVETREGGGSRLTIAGAVGPILGTRLRYVVPQAEVPYVRGAWPPKGKTVSDLLLEAERSASKREIRSPAKATEVKWHFSSDGRWWWWRPGMEEWALYEPSAGEQQ
jgi:hypothetical protein